MKDTLKPTEKAFAIAYAETGKGRESIDKAFPSNEWSNEYKYLKANRMIRKDNVMAEIINRKEVMEASANLASQRLQTIITDGKEHNALMASIFAIEQADGKAKAVTEVKSSHVTVLYDLSGGNGGEIPEEIRKQLEE